MRTVIQAQHPWGGQWTTLQSLWPPTSDSHVNGNQPPSHTRRGDLGEWPHLPLYTEMHVHRSLVGPGHDQCPDTWLWPVAQLKNMKPRLTTMKSTPKTPKHRAWILGKEERGSTSEGTIRR